MKYLLNLQLYFANGLLVVDDLKWQ